MRSVSSTLLSGLVRARAEVALQLVGRPQRCNAETAATAALVLRRRGYPRIDVGAIAAGLEAARLPGRFQVTRSADKLRCCLDIHC